MSSGCLCLSSSLTVSTRKAPSSSAVANFRTSGAAPAGTGHLQVLRHGGDAIGLHDQRPLLFEEAYVEVRVAGHVQGSPPALVDLLVGSDLKVHPLRLHEAHGPGIQIDDLDPLPLVPAQAAEVPFDTFRQVDRFRREQDAVGLL